jgi:hypothetical protein
MSVDWLDEFVDPLIRLGYSTKGDLAEIASALAEDVPNATSHQLREAVKTLRRTWKFMTFPTIAACLEAIRAAPAMPPEEMGRRRPVPTARPAGTGEAPFLRRCRALVDEWGRADERRRMTIGQDRIELARRMIDVYERG